MLLCFSLSLSFLLLPLPFFYHIFLSGLLALYYLKIFKNFFSFIFSFCNAPISSDFFFLILSTLKSSTLLFFPSICSALSPHWFTTLPFLPSHHFYSLHMLTELIATRLCLREPLVSPPLHRSKVLRRTAAAWPFVSCGIMSTGRLPTWVWQNQGRTKENWAPLRDVSLPIDQVFGGTKTTSRFFFYPY